MRRLIKAENGMSIVGQGGRIFLLTLPAVAVAVALVHLLPGWTRLPLPASVLMPLGGALVVLGGAMWLASVVQLLMAFPKGELVDTCAYGACRNPIYASFGLLVIPGLSLLLGTWVYLLVSLVLCLNVWIFIRREEQELLRVFGERYRAYTARVHRLLPFVKPRHAVGCETGARP